MELTSPQFQGLANRINDEGGFTADLRNGGRSPRNRLMVGQRDVPEGEHALPSRGSDVRSYVEAPGVAETVSSPNRFLGGWGHEGKAYLDVPRGFPRTPAGESGARRSAIENDQIAIGVLGKSGNFAGEINNPFHPENRRGDIAASDDAAQRSTWADMPKNQKRTRGRSRKPQVGGESFS